MSELERLRSIGHLKTQGKAQIKALKTQGKTRGYEVEYRDGRVESVMRPSTVKRRISISGDNDE